MLVVCLLLCFFPSQVFMSFFGTHFHYRIPDRNIARKTRDLVGMHRLASFDFVIFFSIFNSFVSFILWTQKHLVLSIWCGECVNLVKEACVYLAFSFLHVMHWTISIRSNFYMCVKPGASSSSMDVVEPISELSSKLSSGTDFSASPR